MRSIVKKTLKAAKKSGNDVIVQVKGNQKILLNDCQRISETTAPDEVYQEAVTKTRNRIEHRTVEIFIAPTLTDTLILCITLSRTELS